MNKREIAHRYGVSERAIQEWMEQEMIPLYKPGSMVRLDPEERDIALNRYKVPSGGHCEAMEASASANHRLEPSSAGSSKTSRYGKR